MTSDARGFALPELSAQRPLVWFVALELLYIGAVRAVVYFYHGSAVGGELIWTALRLASALALGILFRRTLWGDRAPAVFPLVLVPAAAALLVIPLIFGNGNMTPPLSYLYAATSLAVGVREEFAYRGILQQLLLRKGGGFWRALLISNVAFMLYHLGVQPLTLVNFSYLFAVGCTLGLFYHLTRSLALVVALHSLYDALWCFTPVLKTHAPPPLWCGLVVLAYVLAWLVGMGQPERRR